jgi:cytochrome c
MHRSVLRTGLVIGALVAAGGARADFDDKKANETMTKAGCAACHRVDGKSVGPSYKDVAKKYKGQKDAVANLSGKVRKGGAGVWGPIPMSPNPPDKISDGDLKELTEWILKR